jgi:hypothetical protein
MADEYLALNAMAEAIFACPAALRIIPQPEQYARALGDILPMAAEESYTLGVSRLHLNTIQSAREAYMLFAKANEYVNGYRDVDDKMSQALYLGTLKVVVKKPVTPQNYSITADFFFNNLMAEMSQVTANRFVRFYTPEEASRERLNSPDQYLVLEFADFTVGVMRESKSTVQLSRDSVLVGTTTVNGKSQNVYGTVKAELTTFRREVIAQGTLSVQMANAANGRVEQMSCWPAKRQGYACGLCPPVCFQYTPAGLRPR